MRRTVWQNPWVRAVTTLLTVVVMVLIFCFSMETADQSDRTSGKFSRQVVKVLHPEYEKLEPVQQKTIFDSVQHIVRKCAHFTEYLVLGFILRLCLESWFGHRTKKSGCLTFIGFLTGFAYACSDEVHQLSIEGRSGQWTDVLVDGSGVIIGVLLGILLVKALNGKIEEKKKPIID